MKKLLLVTTALVAIATADVAIATKAAVAADMPVKAQRFNPLVYPYTSSGFYWGVGVGAGVANASGGGTTTLVGGLLSGTQAASGGTIGGTFGYIWAISGGTKWLAIQQDIDYQNIAASVPAAGYAVSTKFATETDVRFGGFDFSWLPALIPGFSFPTLPAPPTVPGIAVVGTTHPYVFAGVRFFSVQATFGLLSESNAWEIAPVLGAGVLSQMVDTTGKLTGSVLDVGAKVIFAGKGIGLNSSLSDPTATGTAGFGTAGMAYAKVLF